MSSDNDSTIFDREADAFFGRIKAGDELESANQALLESQEYPGFATTLDPDEAEQLGAFTENALSLEDALDSVFDAEMPEEGDL